MLELAHALAPAGMAVLAPQAAGQVWYPQRFTEPFGEQRADLSSALSMVADLVARLRAAGVPDRRIVLGGFSQGACLALEFTARHPVRLGATLGFSGGLIGASVGPYPAERTLEGLPVLIGCSEHDPHIPAARVRDSTAALTALGAAVQMLLYPGDSHTVIEPGTSGGTAVFRGFAAALIRFALVQTRTAL